MTSEANNHSQDKRRALLLSILEASPHTGATLARTLFALLRPTPLTMYMATKGIHPTNLSQGLAGHGKPGTQRGKVRGLVAEALGLEIGDIWPDMREAA